MCFTRENTGTARTQRARRALDAESSRLQGPQSWAPPAPLDRARPGSSPGLCVLPRRDGATSWSEGDNSRNQACEKHRRKLGNPRFFSQEISFFSIRSKNSYVSKDFSRTRNGCSPSFVQRLCVVQAAQKHVPAQPYVTWRAKKT